MSKRFSESGATVRGLLYLAFLLTTAVLVVSFIFGVVVPPGYIGVIQRTMGPWEGFSSEGLVPGFHLRIPIYSKIHLIPQNIQIIDIHSDGVSTGSNLGDGLEIKTADGAFVAVDVSIFARFFAQAARKDGIGGPDDLINRVGATQEAWQKQIVTAASDTLTRSLSSLHASQFYDPFLREKALEEAETNMRERLKPYGISLEGIFIRRYAYVDHRIDQAIFDKNIQNQEEALNQASGKLSEARAKLEQVSAEWDAKIETLKVEGENRARVIHSEADLYEKEKRAEGDLKYAKAQAEIDKLRAGALSQTGAAEIYIARQMTPILSSVQGGIVSQTDPYDLEQWLRKLGIAK